VIVGTTLMPVIAGAIADHLGLAAALWISVLSQVVVAGAMIAVRETAPRVRAARAASAAA
ncbi:MAG TPA: MFS transporter, partial [Burkholderiales bacterium]|nr:MFS transporter [Burkholderiales bacterium]